ncbi:MAG: HEAT repeat domain-containing protein [Planctomycetota bacterium]
MTTRVGKVALVQIGWGDYDAVSLTGTPIPLTAQLKILTAIPMNQPTESSPETDPSTHSSMSAGDVLPPVQAPAAGFIMQLFLIPLLIVSIIVAVWFMFSYLARTGNDPAELVNDISRVNHSSWQKALTLAQLIRDPQQTELRSNRELADKLAGILEDQVESGRSESDYLYLRIYLCRVLGEFDVDSGFDALAQAAVKEERIEDVQVRKAALQALVILAGNLDDATVAKHKTALESIIKSSEEYADVGDEKIRRQSIRSTATYVLGLFPGEDANKRLGELLNDPSLDVSYNAAIGLARHGDARALPILEEMLDPPEEALKDPTPENSQVKIDNQTEWKRGHVILNALRSIGKMKTKYPQMELGALPDAIKKLSEDESQPSSLRIQAGEVLRSIAANSQPQ